MGLWSSIRGDVFGSLAGGLIGSALGGQSAKKQAALQRQNWAYAQSNAHQFEVNDLKAAGLNPILSATNSQIAGMGSAPSISDNGMTAAMSSSVTSALSRALNADIEGKKLDNDLKRIKIERDTADADIRRASAYVKLTDADIAYKNSAKNLNEAQAAFVDTQGKELVRLNSAQIDSIYNHMANESAHTSALISEIESKKSVNAAQVGLLQKQALNAVENSSLMYWQKQAIIQDINSASRKLRNLTDEQRYQYLLGSLGNIQNQTGFGLSLLNPFSSFGLRAGSGYVGSK